MLVVYEAALVVLRCLSRSQQTWTAPSRLTAEDNVRRHVLCVISCMLVCLSNQNLNHARIVEAAKQDQERHHLDGAVCLQDDRLSCEAAKQHRGPQQQSVVSSSCNFKIKHLCLLGVKSIFPYSLHLFLSTFISE